MTNFPTPAFAPKTDGSLPLFLATPESLSDVLDALGPTKANWARSVGFEAAAGAVVILPDENGKVTGAIGGMGSDKTTKRRRFTLASIAKSLPAGNWSIASELSSEQADEASLAWLLAGYSFGK